MMRLRAALSVLALLAASSAFAETTVENAWVRATAGNGRVTAGYAVIANNSAAADTLLSVSVPEAKIAEVHESKPGSEGVMSMLPVGALSIPAGKLQLKPGGLHVMIMQLSRPLKAGETLPLVFHFKNRGAVKVDAKVAPLGAAAYPAN